MTIEYRKAGDKRIPAKDWNALASAHNGGMIGDVNQDKSSQRNPVVVRVKNETGASLPRFAVVGLGDSLISITTNAGEWRDGIVIKAEIPELGTHNNKFAVLTQSLKDNEIGDAIVMGVTQVKLNINSSTDTHAAISDGETDYLETGTTGVEIIWKETGTGEKWGIVLLDRSYKQPTFRRHYAQMANSSGSAISTLIDYTQQEGYIFFQDTPNVTQGGIQIPSGNDPYTNGTFVCMESGTYKIEFNITMWKRCYNYPSGGPLSAPPSGTITIPGAITSSSGTPAHTHTYESPAITAGTYCSVEAIVLPAGTSNEAFGQKFYQQSFDYSTDHAMIAITGSLFMELTAGNKKTIRILFTSQNGGVDTQYLLISNVIAGYWNLGTLFISRLN